ncbi:hypothetical protein CNECB9_2260056 [Cupriavidus necator]|uniref:Uncharacterized protein n=1 Tax=Cupriavidus necator TaxID=106590 RepID=A0A1K0ICY1_CUPNE|nr:hypothetical protein CNECB9_2260056 [Cupriavidus necator]
MPAPQILQVGPLAPQTNATLQQQYGAAALWQQADPIAWARSEGQQVGARRRHSRSYGNDEQRRMAANWAISWQGICGTGH